MKGILSLNKPHTYEDAELGTVTEVFVKRGKYYLCLRNGAEHSRCTTLAGAWNLRTMPKYAAKTMLKIDDRVVLAGEGHENLVGTVISVASYEKGSRFKACVAWDNGPAQWIYVEELKAA
jgi:hypothetical protein